MNFMKKLLLAAAIISINMPAVAALKYKQNLTLSSWRSQEDLEEKVQEFCNAAVGDQDIKVIEVKYKKKKSKMNFSYEAIITCHVSEKDKDLIRIQGKIFQQKHGLVPQ